MTRRTGLYGLNFHDVGKWRDDWLSLLASIILAWSFGWIQMHEGVWRKFCCKMKA